MGIEPTHKGFADLSLTTWVPRPSKHDKCLVTNANHHPTRFSSSRRGQKPADVDGGRGIRDPLLVRKIFGAGDGGRTRDIDLGKVALYH